MHTKAEMIEMLQKCKSINETELDDYTSTVLGYAIDYIRSAFLFQPITDDIVLENDAQYLIYGGPGRGFTLSHYNAERDGFIPDRGRDFMFKRNEIIECLRIPKDSEMKTNQNPPISSEISGE